jgi:hypothetical protein
MVIPPYPLGTGVDITPFSIDLSPFGINPFESLGTIQSVPLLKTSANGKYRLYSTIPGAFTNSDRMIDLFNKMATRLEVVETNWGFTAGEKLQNIFFIPSNTMNARVRSANPNTLFVWDEMISFLETGRSEFVIDHESSHCFDFQLGLSRFPAFATLHETLSRSMDDSLFQAINESHFLDSGFGGHAGDDEYEFLASLINTINAPDWQNKVSQMEKRVRGLYYHALLVFKEALGSLYPQALNAPMGIQLTQRIKTLETAEAHASLADYTLPLTSDLLEKTGIHFIDTVEFLQTIPLTQAPPAVVYLFNENERDLLPYIQLKKQSIEALGARFFAMPYENASDFILYFGGRISSASLNVFCEGKIVYNSSHEFDNLLMESDRLEIETGVDAAISSCQRPK